MARNADPRPAARTRGLGTAELLEILGVAAELRALVRAAEQRRGVHADLVSGEYVSLAPGAGGHIAAYVHRKAVSIALPPRRATSVAAAHGWVVEPDSGITSYVRITSEQVADAPADVFAVLLEAVDWRAAGPVPTLRPVSEPARTVAAVPRVLDICPVHHMQRLGGRCDSCD